MKKSTRLATLKIRLKKLKKEKAKVEPEKFHEGGGVNVRACMECDRIDTDIHLTLKKMAFVKQGKSFLGDPLGARTSHIDNLK